MIIVETIVGIQLLILLWTVASYLFYRNREMPFLESLGSQDILDDVLIIVPAKDEADGIGPCLDRLSRLEKLKSYRVIAVNDRSTDHTEDVMRAQAQKSPSRIGFQTIKALPDGWLGKNHACWEGVQEGLRQLPNAKYILFTDGDVKFHPECIAEAISWMKTKNLSFMSLMEEAEYDGLLEPAYLLLFGIFMVFIWARPWTLFRKSGKNYFGNGAFLLFKTEAYVQAEVHSTLRLEVVEDMRSGLLMRSRGENCGAAIGVRRMKRRWQPGFTGVFKGLLKNAFAGFDYDLLKTSAGMLLFPLFFTLPWVALFSGGVGTLIGAPTLLLLAALYYYGGQSSGLPFFTSFLLSPFLAFVASANLGTSTFRTLKDGGVRWRNTVYSLQDLRDKCFTDRRAFARFTRS